MEMEESRKFKRMILTLGRLVKADELNKLKYLCKDIIPNKHRDKITTVEGLLEMLEERGKVSPRDLAYLKQLLRDGLDGRTDVLTVVDEYEHGGAVSSPEVDSIRIAGLQIRDFHQEIQYLKDNLGREYKSFLRRIGVEDHDIDRIEIENPKNVKEVIHQCLRVWLHDHKQLQHGQIVRIVMDALKKEKRNDLVRKFESGTFE